MTTPVRLLVLHQGAVSIFVCRRLGHELIRLDRLVLVDHLVVGLVAHLAFADLLGSSLHLGNLALNGVVFYRRANFNFAFLA